MIILLQTLSAFIATLCFSALFNVSKKQIVLCGLTGAIGWLFYLLFYSFSSSATLSSFIGTFMVSIVANILARIRKQPVTVFQISGIIPLVPGLGMYYTLYYMVNSDYDLTLKYLFETFQVAASIAFAMVIVASFNKTNLKKNKHKANVKQTLQ